MLLSLLLSLNLVKRSSHSYENKEQSVTVVVKVACFKILYRIENMIVCLITGQDCIVNYQRYNSLLVLLLSSHHGVAFARSCLAVCKYAHIVAFKGMSQHLLPDVLVHLPLGRIVDVLRLQTERERGGIQGKR